MLNCFACPALKNECTDKHCSGIFNSWQDIAFGVESCCQWDWWLWWQTKPYTTQCEKYHRAVQAQPQWWVKWTTQRHFCLKTCGFSKSYGCIPKVKWVAVMVRTFYHILKSWEPLELAALFAEQQQQQTFMGCLLLMLWRPVGRQHKQIYSQNSCMWRAGRDFFWGDGGGGGDNFIISSSITKMG